MSRDNRSEGGLLLSAGAVVAAVVALPLALLLLLVLILTAHKAADDQRHLGGWTGLNTAGIPAEWVPWITKAGAICPQVDAPLIAAQLRVESNFTSPPPNSAGAAGPAQFTDAGWADWGVDADSDGVKDRMSVADAVMALGHRQCTTWAKLAPAYPTNTLDVVLAAYNAGLGAVEQAHGVPPFSETVNYVARVKRFIATYSGALVAGGGWRYPMAAGTFVFTNTFGYTDAMYASTSNWLPYHTGLDFAAAQGTPVYAAASGKVSLVQTVEHPVIHSSWGNMVTIDHGVHPTARGERWVQTSYGHLVDLAVEQGAVVEAGQLIGHVGTTGRSSGPHLHFEVHLSETSTFPWAHVSDSNFVDPKAWLDSHLGQSAPTSRGAAAAAFAAARVGSPVALGGEGPTEWDGIGLARAAWAAQGVTLPSTISQIAAYGADVTISQATAGDLVLFTGDVGVLDGRGHVICATAATVTAVALSDLPITSIRHITGG